MANCPFRNFEKCPESNGDEGCQLWVSYKMNGENGETITEGCASVLTPVLLIQSINNTAIVANKISILNNSVDASRFESIRDNEAIRVQMLTLASGNQQLIVPNFDPNPNPNPEQQQQQTPEDSHEEVPEDHHHEETVEEPQKVENVPTI